MAFAGFSSMYMSDIITIRRGTVDAHVYIDDCIDQSGLIPGMNQVYGP
jgi:hypothetical protein